jgi:hypothetical protein
LSTHLDIGQNSSFPSVYPETVSYFKGDSALGTTKKVTSSFCPGFINCFLPFPQDISKYKNKQSEFLLTLVKAGWEARGHCFTNVSLYRIKSQSVHTKEQTLTACKVIKQ